MKIPPVKIYFSEEDRKEILEKINKVLESGYLTLGQFGKDFEQEFLKYIGTNYAITTNSGTSALEILFRSLDIKNKEVLVPTNTFFATPASVLHAGGRVKFIDIDPNTFSPSLNIIKEAITKDTAAVVMVHIAGVISPEINEIAKFCADNNLILIEDAAHAQGSSLGGKMAGSFGYGGAFSFYPTKVMTSGEGGMITTNDKNIYEESLIYRDQGKAGFLENKHTRLGYNWRMSEVHAILGLHQLRRLENFIADRVRIAKIYDEGLETIKGLTALKVPGNARSNYYKYIALLDKGIDRTKLKKILKEKYEVFLSGEVYDTPCHLQPIAKELGYKEGDFPVAEDVCSRHICLPIFATMTQEQATYVLNSLNSALNEVLE